MGRKKKNFNSAAYCYLVLFLILVVIACGIFNIFGLSGKSPIVVSAVIFLLFLCIFGLISSLFVKTHCDICKKEFGERIKQYNWKIEDKKLVICSSCNRKLKRYPSDKLNLENR